MAQWCPHCRCKREQGWRWRRRLGGGSAGTEVVDEWSAEKRKKTHINLPLRVRRHALVGALLARPGGRIALIVPLIEERPPATLVELLASFIMRKGLIRKKLIALLSRQNLIMHY